MNFQYLQCLDLWNQKYIDAYENKSVGDYDVLDSNNDGKIVLGLDIPKTASQINADIQKLEKQLKQRTGILCWRKRLL